MGKKRISHRQLTSIYKDFDEFHQKGIPKKVRKRLAELTHELREGLARKYPELDSEAVDSIITWSLEKVGINLAYDITIIEQRREDKDASQTTLTGEKDDD
jgi:hypothetical protein